MAFNPDVSVFINAVGKLSDADLLQYSEMIFRDLTQGSEIKELHDIVTGVQANNPIPFMDRGEDWEYMKDASGLTSQCDPLPCDVGIGMSIATWNPVPYACTLEFCSKDLELPMLDFFNSVRLLEDFDENTFYIDFLKQLIGQRLKNSLWTKAYFAATTATSTALTGHNGLFVQYDAATTGTDRRIDIAKNGGASYAAQKLTSLEGFQIVEAVNEAIEDDRELNFKEGVEIRVTKSIATAYLRWLRENMQVNCCERDPQTGIYSIDSLSIYSRPIKVVSEWDMILNSIAEFDSGTAKVNPHRAVATYKGSSPIGTPDEAKLSELKLKYDDYNEKAKFVSRYRIDSKLVIPEHVILAM